MQNVEKKNLTQEQLAEQLGVSNRAISKWETGRGLPNLSLFEPLCEILEISVNELMSGERVQTENYQKKLETNIVEMIDYSHQRLMKKNTLIGITLLISGLFTMYAAISMFSSESSWSAIFSIIGVILTSIGFSRFTINQSVMKQFVYNGLFFISLIVALLGLDVVNVKLNHLPPRFSFVTTTQNQITQYQTPFYNVYRVNAQTRNEYMIFDGEKQYTIDTLPISPFNRNHSGIETLQHYQNEYVGNNSNTSQLIEHLPLSEFGYVFEITEEVGLNINYHMTDWYINEDCYLEKALMYNSLSIYLLLKNVDTITYNFVGQSYTITKEKCEQIYPHFNEITIDTFNDLVEVQMKNTELISDLFQQLIA